MVKNTCLRIAYLCYLWRDTNFDLLDMSVSIFFTLKNSSSKGNLIVIFFLLLIGLLRYEVDFQKTEPLDELGTASDLDDY